MRVRPDFDSELNRLGDLSWLASTLASDAADGDGVLPPSIKPLQSGSRAVGFATTVGLDRDDNRDMPAAIERGPFTGRILVAGGGGDSVRAVLGGITGYQMVRSGFAALVTDGLVRDRAELEQLTLGVWSRGTTPSASRKEGPGGRPGSVSCGGVLVHDGDLVTADDDGVVVWPREAIEALLVRARERLEADEHRIAELRSRRH